MKLKALVIGALGVAVGVGPMVLAAAAQPKEMFIPLLVYRSGPFAPSGVPIANGFVDYFSLINDRDGGVNGVKLTWEECETQYATDKGVECYERLKGKGAVGAALVNPYSTGITYQLIPKAAVDKIPVFSMGYGMTASADGRWFPWVFNFPTTYWSQASAVIRYIGQQEGGPEKLKGKKIVHIYHNSPYGKEANPTLEELARRLGFELTLLAVDSPGQEQKATWLQVRKINPNWIFLSGWGVMNQVAVKEAAAINFPMDHFIGNWWSASDADVIPAGDGAKGYKGATFHAPGTNFKVHQDIFKHVYEKGKGAGERGRVGEVLYNRGVVNAMFSVEAIRTAMAKYGNKPLTGEQVRWGFEHLNLTDKRLEELGMKGFTHPVKITCEDHEGAGPVLFEQWDGKKWNIVSDWIPVMRDVVRPKLEAAAVEEGKKLGYTMRDCSKEQ
ncbi:MAG TPA: ABC transporter substrate-binding protein [Methylomirabilota bacterium]|nr:ABC transporter substrate-binding protein [Methylomirabilota bacterium]